jgi:hypothetical protein
MYLDKVPLWRGNHVSVRQLVEDFASYYYLPRVAGPDVVVRAVQDGVATMTWATDGFGYADSYDDEAKRYRGLKGGQQVLSIDAESRGLLVRPDVAAAQIAADRIKAAEVSDEPQPGDIPVAPGVDGSMPGAGDWTPTPRKLTRYHGSVELDSARVARDVGVIATEVLAHLVGLDGTTVRVTLEIEADSPAGVPDNVVRIVLENGKSLKFGSQGFEQE